MGINSGGVKSGKNRYIITALKKDGKTIPKSKLPKGLKLVKLDMSNRVDKYSEIDYKKDKFEGKLPLVEITLFVVLITAYILWKGTM